MWGFIKKAINSNLAKPLDTLMTEQFNSWAEQRARIDTNMASRADQATVNAIKTKTDLITAGLGGVKSIQRGITEIKYNNTIADVSISPVNTGKSFLLISSVTIFEGQSIPVSDIVVGSFYSASVIRLSKWANANTRCSVSWQVVEFF